MRKLGFSKLFGYKQWMEEAKNTLEHILQETLADSDAPYNPTDPLIPLDSISRAMIAAKDKDSIIKIPLQHIINVMFDNTMTVLLEGEERITDVDTIISIAEQLMEDLGTDINYGNYEKNGTIFSTCYPSLSSLCRTTTPEDIKLFLAKFPDYNLNIVLSKEAAAKSSSSATSQSRKNMLLNPLCFDFKTRDNDEIILYSAIHSGQPVMVKILIDAGVNQYYIDQYGETPFYMAIHSEIPEMVRAFLSQDFDLVIPNRDGFTYLDYVMEIKNQQMAKLLIDYNPQNVNILDCQGINTAIVAINTNPEIFAYMLQKGIVNVSTIKNYVAYLELIDTKSVRAMSKEDMALYNKFNPVHLTTTDLVIKPTLLMACENIQQTLKKSTSIAPRTAWEFANWDHRIISKEIKSSLFIHAVNTDDVEILHSILEYCIEQAKYTGYENVAFIVSRLIGIGVPITDNFALINAIRAYEIETHYSYTKDFNSIKDDKVKLSNFHDRTITKSQATKLSRICKILEKMDPLFISEVEKIVIEKILAYFPESTVKDEISDIVEVDMPSSDDTLLIKAIDEYKREVGKKDQMNLESIKLQRTNFATYAKKEISQKEIKTFGTIFKILKKLDIEHLSTDEQIIIDRFQTFLALEQDSIGAIIAIDKAINETSKAKPKPLEDSIYKTIIDYGTRVAEARKEAIITDSVFTTKLDKLNQKITTKNQEFAKAKNMFRFETIKIAGINCGLPKVTQELPKSLDYSYTTVAKVSAEFDGAFSQENLKKYIEYFKKNPDHKFCIDVRKSMGYVELTDEDTAILNDLIITVLRVNKSQEARLIKEASHIVSGDFTCKFFEKSDDIRCKEICASIAGAEILSVITIPDPSPSPSECATPVAFTPLSVQAGIDLPNATMVNIRLLKDIYNRKFNARNLDMIEKLISDLGPDFTYRKGEAGGGCIVVCSKSLGRKATSTHAQHGKKADTIHPAFISELKDLLESAGVFEYYNIGNDAESLESSTISPINSSSSCISTPIVKCSASTPETMLPSFSPYYNYDDSETYRDSIYGDLQHTVLEVEDLTAISAHILGSAANVFFVSSIDGNLPDGIGSIQSFINDARITLDAIRIACIKISHDEEFEDGKIPSVGKGTHWILYVERKFDDDYLEGVIINSAGGGYECGITNLINKILCIKDINITVLNLNYQKVDNKSTEKYIDLNDMSCGLWALNFLERICSNAEQIMMCKDLSATILEIVRHSQSVSTSRDSILEKAFEYSALLVTEIPLLAQFIDYGDTFSYDHSDI